MVQYSHWRANSSAGIARQFQVTRQALPKVEMFHIDPKLQLYEKTWRYKLMRCLQPRQRDERRKDGERLAAPLDCCD